MSQHDDPSPQPAEPPTERPAEPPTAPPTQPAEVAAPPDVPPAPTAAAPPAPVLKTRWRDRAFNLRAMVAVGLAGLVLGAGAGAGTALVAGHDDGPDFRHQRMGGPGQGGFPGWGGRDGQGGPPNPGQLPPGSSQQQQDTPQDGSSADTSGS